MKKEALAFRGASGRVFSTEEVKRFELTRIIPPDLRGGLTSVLLADLYDVVRKFGIQNLKTRQQIVSIRNPEVLVMAPLNLENHSMAITGPVRLDFSWAYDLHLPLGRLVTWDRSVTLKEVELLIEVYDSEMRRKGYIDPHTQERSRPTDLPF